MLTGRAPTHKPRPKGDNITFQFHLSDSEPSKVKAVRVPLFTTDEKPIWVTSFSHPEADLAIIPLVASLFKNCVVNCISREFEKPDLGLIVRPGIPVTIVGYPYGHYDTKNALPIWKTGNIASEPTVDFEGRPLFLVDASIFPGMSGSPTFALSNAWETENGQIVGGGLIKKFMGILASEMVESKKKYLEELSNAKLGITDRES